MIGWFSSQPVNDFDKARGAMIAFHNYSLTNFPGTYKETLDSLILKVAGGTDAKRTAFLEGFGFAINQIGMSVSQSDDAMISLAYTSQGKIPKQNEFFRALSERVSNPTFMDYVGATPQVALDTGKDVVMGFKEVGDAVLDTGKSLLVIGPLLIVAAVVFIGYSRTRQFAGR